jgi:hypothetical protein
MEREVETIDSEIILEGAFDIRIRLGTILLAADPQ